MGFFTNFSLKNASAVLILCLLVIIGGVYASTTLKKETMPDISIPIVAVITVYPGAAPNDVQEKVTKPMEALISNVQGIKMVSANSAENISSVIAQFDYSANMKEAQRSVEEAIKSVTLPDGAIAPKTLRIDFGSFPVIDVSVSNPRITPAELEEKVRNILVPSLSGLDGVGTVQLVGGSPRAVYIRLLPSKLKAHNLTSQTVMQMLQANNISFPAGSVSLNDTIQPIQIMGKLSSLDDLRNMRLPVMPNQQASMTSALSQMGQGLSALGQTVGQLGQGVTGLGQATGAQIKLLAAIDETQGQLFAAGLAINEAKQALGDPRTSDQQKLAAQATVAELTPKVKMAEAALGQMQDKLKQIQAQMPGQSGAAPGSVPAGNGQPAQAASPASNAAGSIKLGQVRLGDIAEISIGSSQATSFSRINGNPSVVVEVTKSQSANTIDVANAVQNKVKDLLSTLPKGTKITYTLNQADYVRESISGMMREALLGAFFAFLIILLFLRNIRTTIIASVSIPLSVLITLAFLKQAQITLNIMTLGGLSVAVGRIVDDSIVVIENIYRRMQTEKMRTVELIKLATGEVASAITSSTLTTVAVFLPIAMVGGLAGIMFKPFALTVAVALLSSLLVAVTVIPLLSKLLLLKAKNLGHTDFHDGRLMRFYQRLLTRSLNHKAVVLVLAAVLFLGSLGLLGMVGTRFIPEDQEKFVKISIDVPAGMDPQKVNLQASAIEKILATEKDVQLMQTVVGNTGSANPMAVLSNKSAGSIMVKLRDEADLDGFITRMRTRIGDQRGESKIDIVQTNPNSGSMSGTNSLEVLITCNDLDKLRVSADRITRELAKIKGLEKVANNLAAQKPVIAVAVDQIKASSYALSAAQIGMSIRELLNDNAVTAMTLNKKTWDVRLGLKLDSWNKLDDIRALMISSPLGTSVPLSQIADVREVPGPVSILTQDGQQYAKVTGKITAKNTGSISMEVQKRLKSIPLPDGVETSLGGVSEMMSSTFRDLGMAMIFAVFAVFFVMILALGEIIAPLSILFSLPLAAIGCLTALFITGLPLDMPSMIGALMLIGIVVTNAIVLIDRVQQRRREGMGVRDALLEAGRIRMRPILMTAIATIAALAPLALGISKGSLISQSLAVIVIGGLTTSTFLTLIVVPVAYEMLENMKLRVLNRGKAVSSPEA